MITPTEARILRKALLQNDGQTLCPYWNKEQQRALTEALDKLRLELWERDNFREEDMKHPCTPERS